MVCSPQVNFQMAESWSSEAAASAARHLAAASSSWASAFWRVVKTSRGLRVFGCGEVHAFVFEEVEAEERNSGAVHGEAAEGHGFRVRLPVGLVCEFVGEALEGAAGVVDLEVEVEEEDVGDAHGVISSGGDVVTDKIQGIG